MTVVTANRAAATRSTEAALHWLLLSLVLIWQAGAHVDAWYHLHYGFAIESFVTWPHALLYGGWLGTGAVLAALCGVRAGLGERLPWSLRLGLLGVGLFALGGLFDLVWHTLFGFEVSLEALITPAHTWLLVAFMIACFGLFLGAAEQRARAGTVGYRPRLVDLPVVLSLAMLFRATLWSAIYSAPLAADYAAGGALGRRLAGFSGIAWETMATQVAGTTGMLLYSVVLALVLVASLRSLRLPAGAIAVIMLWEGVMVAVVADMWLYLPAVAGGALAGEALWAWVWRGGLGGPDGEAGYWVLGFVVPTVVFCLYFALMGIAGGGITWTTHLWAGMPFLAGLYGLIVSLFVVPPPVVRAALSSHRA
jgi:hypothetical protein